MILFIQRNVKWNDWDSYISFWFIRSHHFSFLCCVCCFTCPNTVSCAQCCIVSGFVIFIVPTVFCNFQLSIQISRYSKHYWVDTSPGGLLVLAGILRSVVSAETLNWFIRYTYYWNVQFLYNVIIDKTKVLHSQAYVTLEDLWLSCYLALQPFDWLIDLCLTSSEQLFSYFQNEIR